MLIQSLFKTNRAEISFVSVKALLAVKMIRTNRFFRVVDRLGLKHLVDSGSDKELTVELFRPLCEKMPDIISFRAAYREKSEQSRSTR